MGRLDGKAVLVTGGNGGLGSGIVKGMLKEGAKVAFCGRNEEKNQAALKTYREISEDVIAIRCDVSKSAEVKELFAKVVEAFGTVDILVNDAAEELGVGLMELKRPYLASVGGEALGSVKA